MTRTRNSSSLPLSGPSQKRALLFLASALGLYLLWYLLYDLWLLPDGHLNNWLTVQVADSGATVLRWFGYDAHVEQRSHIFIDNRSVIWIDHNCNGLELFMLFAGFILIYPGSWINKLWFIPAGMAAIYLLNILRVTLLTLNYQFSRRSFDFNHKYIFTFIVYVAIFGLWMIWVNRLSGTRKALAAGILS